MMIAELVFLLIKYLMGLGIGSVLICRKGGKSIREEAENGPFRPAAFPVIVKRYATGIVTIFAAVFCRR